MKHNEEESMKRIAGLGGIAVLIALVSLVSMADSVMIFADGDLEAVIREAIDKPTGDIYESDLAGLTTLDAEGGSVSELSGIEYCVNLEWLHLGRNAISDISPLQDLTKLEYLHLGSNNLSDISALSGLTNLWHLGVNENQLDDGDLSALSRMHNLEELRIYLNSGITDISSLSDLDSLQILDAADCNITCITGLEEISSLGELRLSGNAMDLQCLDSPARQTLDAVIAAGVDVTYVKRFRGTLPDETAPVNATIGSSSHNPGEETTDPTVDIEIWGATDTGCGLSGYEVAWDRSPSWSPSGNANVGAGWTGDTFEATEDGDWYFHIAAVDGSGNWSGSSHFGPIRIVTEAESSGSVAASPQFIVRGYGTNAAHATADSISVLTLELVNNTDEPVVIEALYVAFDEEETQSLTTESQYRLATYPADEAHTVFENEVLAEAYALVTRFPTRTSGDPAMLRLTVGLDEVVRLLVLVNGIPNRMVIADELGTEVEIRLSNQLVDTAFGTAILGSVWGEFVND
jgi:hypothetical protein